MARSGCYASRRSHVCSPRAVPLACAFVLLKVARSQGWPACPEKGCMPCPENATGRPDCACLVGYSLDGQPVPGGGPVPIPWSETFGWQGQCEKVICPDRPEYPHADPVGWDPTKLLQPLLYQEKISLLCHEGYYVDGGSRTIDLECAADGNYANHTSTLCLPICGDGKLMDTDHVPDLHDAKEECDDYNINDFDGCSSQCKVEEGFICTGGSPTSPDQCTEAGVFLDSHLVLDITGRRRPSNEEVQASTREALAYAMACPMRDIEISSVQDQDLSTESSEFEQDARMRFHPARMNATVVFRVKVSQPEVLSVDELYGSLDTPEVLRPKLQVGYVSLTSLSDLYVSVREIASPTITGDAALGRPTGAWTLSELLTRYMYPILAVTTYISMITCILPFVYHYVRKIKQRLIGRFEDIAPEFKGAWAFTMSGSCCDNKILCMSLVCLLPARVAHTWDSVGIMSYWLGVRQAVWCCCLYFSGCCLCGAIIPAAARAEMRHVLGFENYQLGLNDYCSYLCCPICCIIQEARHVDAAVKWLPPPLKLPTVGVLDEDEEQPPEPMTMEVVASKFRKVVTRS